MCLFADGDFVLDGELVALDSQGRPSFQLLQNNLIRVSSDLLLLFELLNGNGEVFVNLPL